jgi:hypothetical protein
MASEANDLLEQLNVERRRVDVAVADLTVREVVRMVRDGELNAAPAYQRKFRWKPQDESRLIESLMLGLPVPSVFVAANEDFSLEVVDGLQRVSTLVHYLEPNQEDLQRIGRSEPLVLSGLEKLEKLEGLSFAKLPPEVQRYFGRLGMRVTTLTDKSDPAVRFQLFERLNRGAVALSPQEIRTVVYRGSFINLIKELAELPRFNELVKLQGPQEEDGTRGELVLKFFAYLLKFEEYDGRVTAFLNDFAEQNADVSQSQIRKWRDLFVGSVEAVADATGTPFLRDNYYSTPLNQIEAVLVGAGRILRRGDAVRQSAPGLANDPALVEASTKGTNTRPSFRRRVLRAEELLAG